MEKFFSIVVESKLNKTDFIVFQIMNINVFDNCLAICASHGWVITI